MVHLPKTGYLHHISWTLANNPVPVPKSRPSKLHPASHHKQLHFFTIPSTLRLQAGQLRVHGAMRAVPRRPATGRPTVHPRVTSGSKTLDLKNSQTPLQRSEPPNYWVGAENRRNRSMLRFYVRLWGSSESLVNALLHESMSQHCCLVPKHAPTHNSNTVDLNIIFI